MPLRRALTPSLFALATVMLLAADAPGLDVAGMDRAVKPGDNFFTYANGGWDKTTEIPADRSNWGLGFQLFLFF